MPPAELAREAPPKPLTLNLALYILPSSLPCALGFATTQHCLWGFGLDNIHVLSRLGACLNLAFQDFGFGLATQSRLLGFWACHDACPVRDGGLS